MTSGLRIHSVATLPEGGPDSLPVVGFAMSDGDPVAIAIGPDGYLGMVEGSARVCTGADCPVAGCTARATPDAKEV